MYSEQMMREEGFDDAPEYRLMLHTDAIWRACRIILDIRMHRGELGVDEAVEFLVEQTSFERRNARGRGPAVHVHARPIQLSYLLGQGCCSSSCAPTSDARLGEAFSLRDFHDALLRNGSLPISFHRRLLLAGAASAVERRPDAVQVVPSIDLQAAGRASSTGRAHRPATAHRPIVPSGSPSGSSSGGARLIHLVDFDGARGRRAGEPRGRRCDRVADRGAAPARRRGGLRRGDPAGVRGRRDARRADHGDRRPTRRPAGLPRGRRRLAGRRAGSAPGAARRVSLAAQRATDRRAVASSELVGRGVGRFVLAHGGTAPDVERVRSLVRSYDAEVLVAGGVRDLDGLRRLRDTGVAGVILGEALLSGAIDLTAALEAAA